MVFSSQIMYATDLRIDRMSCRMLPSTTMMDHRQRLKEKAKQEGLSPKVETLDSFTTTGRKGRTPHGKQHSGRRSSKHSSDEATFDPFEKGKSASKSSSNEFDPFSGGEQARKGPSPSKKPGNTFDPFSGSEHTKKGPSPSKKSGNAFDPFSNSEQPRKGPSPSKKSGNAFDPFSNTQQPANDNEETFDPFGEQISNMPAQTDNADQSFDPFGEGESSHNIPTQSKPEPARSKFKGGHRNQAPSHQADTNFDPFESPSMQQHEQNALNEIHKAAAYETNAPEADISQFDFDHKIDDSQQTSFGLEQQSQQADMLTQMENHSLEDTWDMTDSPTEGGSTLKKVPLSALPKSGQQKSVMEGPTPSNAQAPVSTGMGWGGGYQPPASGHPAGMGRGNMNVVGGPPMMGGPPMGYGNMPPASLGYAGNMGAGGGPAMTGGPPVGYNMNMGGQPPMMAGSQMGYNNMNTGGSGPSMMGGGGSGSSQKRSSARRSKEPEPDGLDIDPFADF